jgi:hypothetical protein
VARSPSPKLALAPGLEKEVSNLSNAAESPVFPPGCEGLAMVRHASSAARSAESTCSMTSGDTVSSCSTSRRRMICSTASADAQPQGATWTDRSVPGSEARMFSPSTTGRSSTW